MKLLALNFRGFGPHKEEQFLTFPSARKVAVLGNNGAGKTFLLDTLPATLFKLVPNRKGGFYDNFSGSDAFIDLTFELNGDTYRARRLVNAKSRTQKAFLWKNGEALNDGKDAAFSAEIEKLGLDETSFMAAVYQSQNGTGNALNMDVDSRIKLLSIILDLMKFDTDYEKTVEAHKEISRVIESLRIRKAELEGQIPDKTELLARKQQAEDAIKNQENQLLELDTKIQESIQSVANAKANAQGLDDLKRDLLNLESEIAADETERRDQEERIRNNQELVIDKKEAILAAVATIESEKFNIQVQQGEIQKLQTLAEQAQGSLEQWNKDHRASIAAVNERLTEQRAKVLATEGQLRDAQMAKAKLASAKTAAEGKIVSLRPSTEIIERVPCQGLEINSTCELLKNAHDNVQKIATLTLEIADLEKQIAETEVAIQQAEIKVEDAKSDLSAIDDDLKSIMAQQPPAEFAAALHDFNQRIQATNAFINASNQVILSAEPLAKMADKLEGAEERVAGYKSRLTVLLERLNRNNLAKAEKETKIQEAADVAATIQKAESTLSSLQASRKLTERAKEANTSILGQINGAFEKINELNASVESLRAEIAEHSATLAEIQILREGLGPKGAKNVKIDAAGKAITERANRLIRIGLGPQFSILINTLRELQSKDENGNPEVRETLELKIINNNSGEEMLIENLSGGEKAMAGLVFSLSLAIEQREASGLDIRTLILDEPSAGLSEGNSVKYLEMLDAVLDETGIEQVFFISHMPAMQSLADASILVCKPDENSSSKVEVLK